MSVTIHSETGVVKMPSRQEIYDECQQKWLALDVDTRFRAIGLILAEFKGESGEEDKAQWRRIIADDPLGWWTGYHFWQGMHFRNVLRKGGITDEVVGHNLDDIWVPAFEAAMSFLQQPIKTKPLNIEEPAVMGAGSYIDDFSLIKKLKEIGKPILSWMTPRKDLQSRP